MSAAALCLRAQVILLQALTGLLGASAPAETHSAPSSDDREVVAHLDLLERLELLQEWELLRDLGNEQTQVELKKGAGGQNPEPVDAGR